MGACREEASAHIFRVAVKESLLCRQVRLLLRHDARHLRYARSQGGLSSGANFIQSRLIHYNRQIFLPDEDLVPRKHFRSLYRRTYSKRDQIAVWQRDQSYCEWRVKQKPVYAHGRRLLDLIDMHILDFLMGIKCTKALDNSMYMSTVNQDRHHFEQIMAFDDRDIYPLHFDNGRGFGKTQIDFEDILSPLTQCCLIRPSTARTLLHYYAGPGPMLTEALHRLLAYFHFYVTLSFGRSLSKDPVAPVLPPKHYTAIERRLGKIMRAIDKCISERGAESVLRVSYENPRVPPPGAPEVKKDEEDEDD